MQLSTLSLPPEPYSTLDLPGIPQFPASSSHNSTRPNLTFCSLHRMPEFYPEDKLIILTISYRSILSPVSNTKSACLSYSVKEVRTPNPKREGQQGRGRKKKVLTSDVIRKENPSYKGEMRLTWAEHDADIQVQEPIPPSSPLPQNTEKTQKNQSLLLTLLPR